MSSLATLLEIRILSGYIISKHICLTLFLQIKSISYYRVDSHLYFFIYCNLSSSFFRYKGGPELPRKLISEGVHNSLIVEVYPLHLKLVDARDNSQRTIRMSRQVFTIICFLIFLWIMIQCSSIYSGMCSFISTVLN